ncbi:MAG: tyrosine-type recombinase/integrase [Silvanigrellaceae bacterium]|nr:tyrosine-type recombinase/integrase [Silvanigrellaceae bacterium]
MYHVIDEWFENIKQTHLRGRADLIRYADDMVFCFQHMNDAKRFYEVLPKRLEKFGLTLHDEKSQLIAAGHAAAQRRCISPNVYEKYSEIAGMSHTISPHKLRHFLFTWLKTQGVDDALIQPYSGHETRASLRYTRNCRYQTLKKLTMKD